MNKTAVRMKRIERFDVEHALGDGSFGRVYCVSGSIAGHPKEQYALKLLSDREEVDRTIFADFNKWKKRIGKHANLCEIVEMGQSDHLPFYVMELLRGGSLLDWRKSSGKPKLSELVRIADQLSRAIDHLNRVGIIHRDVKPHNVLFRHPYSECTFELALADFGLAKPLGESPTLRGDKKSAVLRGTPHYMAPELLDADKIAQESFTTKSDVYAFAMTLFYLSKGKTAFELDQDDTISQHDLVDEIRTRIYSTEPPSPETGNPNLDAAILRGLKPSPGDRPATAAELVESAGLGFGCEIHFKGHEQVDVVELLEKLRQLTGDDSIRVA